MTTILQISDTHFGTEQAPVVDALAALSASLAPDVLIVSGDITQRARRGQFTAARAFVDRLGIASVVAIPGNHDVPLYNVAQRAFAPYAEYARAFGADLEPSHDSDDVLILGVNTTRPWRHKDGEVSDAQIERIARRLESAQATQLRIVVTHQPAQVTRQQDIPDRLHRHEQALARWCAAGVDLILGGHIHLPFLVPLHDPHAAPRRRHWVVQAGTALSTRIRHEAPNSVNVIRHRKGSVPRCCATERWDYSSVTRAFERIWIETMVFEVQRARH